MILSSFGFRLFIDHFVCRYLFICNTPPPIRDAAHVARQLVPERVVAATQVARPALALRAIRRGAAHPRPLRLLPLSGPSRGLLPVLRGHPSAAASAASQLLGLHQRAPVLLARGAAASAPRKRLRLSCVGGWRGHRRRHGPRAARRHWPGLGMRHAAWARRREQDAQSGGPATSAECQRRQGAPALGRSDDWRRRRLRMRGGRGPRFSRRKDVINWRHSA